MSARKRPAAVQRRPKPLDLGACVEFYPGGDCGWKTGKAEEGVVIEIVRSGEVMRSRRVRSRHDRVISPRVMEDGNRYVVQTWLYRVACRRKELTVVAL